MPTNSTNNCDINIMIRGIGGQGVKLVGTIIGQAAIYDKRHAVQSMKYGSAITGGETRSEIKVSTKKIIYPRVTEIDVYVALTQDDLDKYFESVVYIAGKEVARNVPKAIKDKTLMVPLLTIAEQVGNIRAANLVLAGVLNQLFNLASQESFIKSIEYLLPIKHHKVNVEAFKMGEKYDLSQDNNHSIIEQADICKIIE